MTRFRCPGCKKRNIWRNVDPSRKRILGAYCSQADRTVTLIRIELTPKEIVARLNRRGPNKRAKQRIKAMFDGLPPYTSEQLSK